MNVRAIYCSACGKANAPEAGYCYNCGKTLQTMAAGVPDREEQTTIIADRSAPKSLFGNLERKKAITVLKTEEATSEMQEGLIGEIQLLPANQQTPRAVEPGVQTFHDPATRLLRGFQIAARHRFWLLCQPDMCSSVVLIGTNMRHMLMRPHRFIHDLVIIASVQAEMLWLFLGGSRACNHDALQGSLNQLHVIAVGTSNHHSQRHATSVTQLAAFGSPLAAIGGIGAGRGSCERGFGHDPIHALPFPGNPFQFVIFLQSCLPDALKHALLLPEPKAIVDGGAGSQFPWQRIPLHASTQHIQNGRQHLPIALSGPSSFRMSRALWDQRAYAFPYFITQFPWFCSFHWPSSLFRFPFILSQVSE